MKQSESWSELYKRISTAAEEDEQFLPADKDIAAFENELETRLPASYTSFIKTFGPGTLAQEFKFYAPGCGDSTWDMAHLNDYYRKAFQRLRKNADALTRPDFLLGIVWFGSTFHGTIFGWNPTEATDKKKNECKVYMMERSEPDARHIADSFDDFVREVCLGDQYDVTYRPDAPRSLEGAREEFTPAKIKKPRKRKNS
jgi:hypothetical protein